MDEAGLNGAIQKAVSSIAATALETLKLAGIAPGGLDAIYFTGGSTGVRELRSAIAAAVGDAEAVMGDPFASVARGLGVYAGMLFGGKKTSVR